MNPSTPLRAGAVSVLTAARKWREIGWDERVMFLQALLMVPAMHTVVRVVGFNWLHQRTARGTPPSARVTSPNPQTVRLCVVSINRVKRYSLFRGNCLSQSLALASLLGRRGIQSSLRLGVRMTDSKFDAHAWVELDGRVLNDTQDVHTRFTPLVANPDA